jgi:hypothetical protein
MPIATAMGFAAVISANSNFHGGQKKSTTREEIMTYFEEIKRQRFEDKWGKRVANDYVNNQGIKMLIDDPNIPIDSKTPDSCMYQAELDNCKPTCPLFQDNKCPIPDEIIELFPDWEETKDFITFYRGGEK